jgi:molecular chaperone HtpG
MTTNNTEQKHQFASDNAKILQLMIHSLYSNKEIVLRELV